MGIVEAIKALFKGKEAPMQFTEADLKWKQLTLRLNERFTFGRQRIQAAYAEDGGGAERILLNEYAEISNLAQEQHEFIQKIYATAAELERFKQDTLQARKEVIGVMGKAAKKKR